MPFFRYLLNTRCPLIWYALLYLGRCVVAICRCLWLWQLHFGVSLRAAMSNLSILPSTPSQTEACSTMGKSIRPTSFYNTTLSANKHCVQICRFSLSAVADGLADCSGENRSSPFNGDAQSWNGIEWSLSRAVAPQSQPISATTFQEFRLCTAQDACERISGSQAVLKSRTVQSWSVLHAWSMPTKCCWVVHSRLTSKSKTSTSPLLFFPPHSSAKLVVFTCFHELVLYIRARNAMTRRQRLLISFYLFSVDRFVWADNFFFCRDET